MAWGLTQYHAGSSDPCAFLNLDGEKRKSRVIKKNVNPQWMQTFRFPCDDGLNVTSRVEIDQCVGCYRHAIEQASRRWRGGRRGDSGRTRRNLISAQVSGGRGANTNAANQYVINDGFEALHVRRLKHVWQHLTERLDAVEDSARELSVAVALADVDDGPPARFPGQPDTPTPLQSRRSTPRTEAAQDRAAELLAGSSLLDRPR